MKTLIIITAIYLLLIVLVIALCKIRAISDKRAKEIHKNKTNEQKTYQRRANNKNRSYNSPVCHRAILRTNTVNLQILREFVQKLK